MKKLALFATLFAVVTAFAGNFEAECQKVEMWIAETFTKANPSFRLQHNILRRIRNTKGSDEEKIAALRSKFPKAFGEGWKSKLAAAKQQGITFSSDNKTLLKCPKNVTSVVIPSCVKIIERHAFLGCKNLTGVMIPDSVTTIGNYVFLGCENLTSVTIPNSVTTIGKEAFFGCENLTNVTLPNSVTTIGEAAFQKVQKVQVSAGNTVFKVDDSGALLDIKNNRLLYLPGGFRGEYIVPEGITTIGYYAFLGCKNLIGVTIPDSVTTIGDAAFLGCEKLTSVTIPDSVTTIGGGAFLGCENLTSVTIPNSVTTIGEVAFLGCENLTSVTIPNSVTTIGPRAFWGVPKVQVSSDNTVFMVDDYGALLDMENNRLLYLPPGFQGEYVIPEGITTIGMSAFNGCKKLTGVTIPNSVTTIGDWAFQGCEKLTSVTIPNSVTTIGYYAFRWCKNLTGVTIPNSVTTIGDWAFQGCENLTSITLPPRCGVGQDAFPENCKVIRR